MDDTNRTADPAPNGPTSAPSEAPEETSQKRRLVDLAALVALLGVTATVYLAVGDAGFTVITSAVVGLYGTWRARR
ncbi:hypothetical protein OG226_24335 [Streptomyces sp. NBC_01261]|uniref:hypothetical protein n=1 Tax=Streptomyces sp. NBC_01261 TaxID=2903802 RepID=UPI002E350BF2|nr:hypothetical protein [Streptomyces sp. NBC_01261]